MNDVAYLREQGLDRYLDLSAADPAFADPYAMVRLGSLPPAPADVADLARLHRLVRSRRSFTVLEFGVGHSTVVLADALAKNRADWDGLATKPAIRNRFMFQLFTVDASEKWLEQTRTKFPEPLREHVTFHHSTVKIGTHHGMLCHFYENLPDIVPDFIYLDGPDPKDVRGSINGLSFQCDERTVMAADLLLMEPTLLPGTFIIVDGRTNNARFLARNFQRTFETVWDRDGDVTTMELVEDRLGPLNILGSDVF